MINLRDGAVIGGAGALQGQSYRSSEEALTYLARQHGSADYRSWQILRRKWYSRVTYPEAGAGSFAFFSTPPGQGGLTIADTNIPKANSFGQQHGILKSIQAYWYIQTWDIHAWAGTDASTLVSDIIAGFIHAGLLQLQINARLFAQIPKPFLYCPRGDGSEQVYTRGLDTLTLTEGTPNVIATSISAAPYAEIIGYRNIYVLDPQIMIEAEQNFSVTIDFPSGAIAVIGTGVTDDTTNPLKVGVRLDTITARPKQ